MEEVLYPTIDSLNPQIICALLEANESLYAKTYQNLKDNILPPNLSHNQKQNLIHQLAHYTIIADTLYRWGLDSTLLRCLEQEEFEKFLH